MMACTHPLNVPNPLRDWPMATFPELYFPRPLPKWSPLEVSAQERTLEAVEEVVPEQLGVPAEVWEWLCSREERRSKWEEHGEAWWKGQFRRQDMCDEMGRAQRPFRVTQYSLAGVCAVRLFSGNTDGNDIGLPT